MKLSRIVALTVSAVLAVSLSGCSDAGGRVAARVDGTAIATSEVDTVSRVSCALSSQSQQPGSSAQAVSTMRDQSLNLLISMQLTKDLAKKEHATYDRSQLLTAIRGIDQQVESFPAKDRAKMRDLIEKLTVGQLQLAELAKRALTAQGEKSPSQDAVQAAGDQILAAYQKTADISIDPKYAPDGGNAGAGDGSLSRAVSDYAKQGSAKTPKPSWVMALPAAQRCGG